MSEKKCVSCEADLDVDAIFCNECGAVQAAAVSSVTISETPVTIVYKTCPQCQKQLAESTKFCSGCAFDFTKPSIAETDLMTCPNCQKNYGDDDRFCRHCAFDLSQIAKVSSAHFCTACGKPFELTDKFCRGCAADLSKSNHTVGVPIVAPNARIPLVQNPLPNFSPSVMPIQSPNIFSPSSVVSPTLVSENIENSKPNGLQWISPSMAGIALICFFMPWIEVSCNAFGSKVGGTSISGADLAKYDGSLWLLPLFAIGILAAFFVFKSQEKILKSRPFILIGAGLALLFMIFKAFNVENSLREMPNMGFGTEWRTGLDSAPRFGISGVIIGFVGALVGVIFLGNKSLKDSINTIKSNLAGLLIYIVPLVLPPLTLFLLPLLVATIFFPLLGRTALAFAEFSLVLVILTPFIAQVFFLKKKTFKSNLFIRFHAFQSLILIGLNIAASILLLLILGSLKSNWAVDSLLPPIKLISWGVALSYIGLMIFCAVKANKNETFKIPHVGDWAMNFAQKGLENDYQIQEIMKVCPQCNSVFPEDYVFCLNDGTILGDNDGEQETVVQAKIGFEQPTSTLSPEMLVVCSSCSLANRSNSKFCKKCGTPLGAPHISAENQTPPINPPFGFPKFEVHPLSSGGQPINPASFQNNPNPIQTFGETVAVQNPNFAPPNFAPQGISGIENPYSPARNNRSLASKLIFIGVLLGIVLTGGIVWYLNQPHPIEAKLDKAITNNQLLSPSAENAFEFYHELKKDGVDAKVLGKYEDRLFPLLSEKPNDVLKTVSEPGITEKRLEEWQDAQKMLDWANEIRPADDKIAARAAYCKGRINYLTEQLDAAIADWKKAADLDKKWALPLNGIGLIYNERKDYESARKWLLQAIEREPNWAIPYNNLGSSFYFQKRYSEAAPYYQKALEISPRWARPHAWLGSIAMENYDYQTAVNEFDKVLAPDALGASEMNLESIRKQQEKARNMANYNYGY